MRGNRLQRGNPRLTQSKDGTYTCSDVDDFLEKEGLELAGMDAYVSAPGMTATVIQVPYPLPAQVFHYFPIAGGGRVEILLSLTEVWVEFPKKDIYPFAVYEESKRIPFAYLKVDH